MTIANVLPRDKVKERSAIGDLLYLRCRFQHFSANDRARRFEVEVAWDVARRIILSVMMVDDIMSMQRYMRNGNGALLTVAAVLDSGRAALS